MFFSLEHPQVSAARRWGYPGWVKTQPEPECACGGALEGWIFEFEGQWLCRDCFIEAVSDYCRTNPREAAQAFGCCARYAD